MEALLLVAIVAVLFNPIMVALTYLYSVYELIQYIGIPLPFAVGIPVVAGMCYSRKKRRHRVLVEQETWEHHIEHEKGRCQERMIKMANIGYKKTSVKGSRLGKCARCGACDIGTLYLECHPSNGYCQKCLDDIHYCPFCSLRIKF